MSSSPMATNEGKIEMADVETPIFRKDCQNCDFCTGLREENVPEAKKPTPTAKGD